MGIFKKRKKKENVSEETLPQFMQDDMQHARLGVLYIFAHARADGKFGSLFLKSLLDTGGNYMKGAGKFLGDTAVETAGTVTGAAKTPIEQVVKYFEKDEGAKSNIQKDKEKETASTLWQKITAFLNKTVKALWKKLTEDVLADMSKWGSVIKTVIKGIVGKVVAAAVPLSGIFDVVSGCTKAFAAGFQRVMSWLESSSVSMLRGTPVVIVSAVQKAMNRSIGEGLYTAVKGGIQIGVDSVTAGAGSLAKAIATAVELLVQVIQRIVEIELFSAFSREAKVHWNARATSGFTKEPEAFARWMKRYAFKVPAIGALAINCGYCGSPMQYLNLFNDDKSVVSQKDFDAGVAMLARVKRFAADYLNDIGLAFASDDPAVNGALKAAKAYNQKTSIKHNTVGDVVYGILTG